MAVNQKETERTELHKTIWQIANDLRGSVDGWDFKQYVLGMMFYRFISENITSYIDKNQQLAGDTSFNFELLDDTKAELARRQVVQEKKNINVYLKGIGINESSTFEVNKIDRSVNMKIKIV